MMEAPCKNLLIIDDDNADRRLLVDRLQHAFPESGWIIRECNDGTSALDTLHHQHFDCVLLDYKLPDMDGLSVLHDLRAYDNDTPVVMMTGQGNEDIAVEAFKNGAQDYVTKSKILQEPMDEVIDKAIQRKQGEVDLLRRANFDVLTGLVNRARFIEEVTQAMARSNRSKIPFALVYVDVNKFKDINDNYGHNAGDKILQEIGHRIRHVIREGDTPARLGGDEFAIIMEGVSGDGRIGKYLVIDRMIQELNMKPYRITPDLSLDVSVSIGTALYPIHAHTLEDLIHDADQAMYQAKKSGYNHVGQYARVVT